jgi:hypothetical protein
MDCLAVLWDTLRGRPLQDFSTQDRTPGVSAMINPPFVHSLSIHADGQWAVAALGNADVAAFDLKSRAEVRRLHGHSSPVAAVYVAWLQVMMCGGFSPCFHTSSDDFLCVWECACLRLRLISQFAEFDPHMLVSVSNDRTCVLWHVTPSAWTTGAGSTPAAADCTVTPVAAAAAAAAAADVSPDRLDTDDASSGPAAAATGASATRDGTDGADTAAVAGAAPAASKRPAWGLHTAAPSDFSAHETHLFDTTLIRSRWRLPDKPNALQTVVLPSGLAGVVCADASNVVTLFTLR